MKPTKYGFHGLGFRFWAWKKCINLETQTCLSIDNPYNIFDFFKTFRRFLLSFMIAALSTIIFP